MVCAHVANTLSATPTLRPWNDDISLSYPSQAMATTLIFAEFPMCDELDIALSWLDVSCVAIWDDDV